MKYGIQISEVNKLPQDPREICGPEWQAILPVGSVHCLYFGSEFCQDLLPTVKQAQAFCELAKVFSLEGVLQTSMVTPQGLRRIDTLLAKLTKRDLTPTVVFNDWGVLSLLRKEYPQLKVRAGRLINRALRDPRLTDQFNNPGTLAESRGTRLRSMLARFSVSAIETDPDLEGGYLGNGSEGLERVLHLPYAYAVTGRNCLIKAEAADDNSSFTKGLGHPCASPCLGRVHPIEREDTRLPLWRVGNTIFYEVPRGMAEAHLPGADMLVLQQRYGT
jgi:hypothetical protein